MMKIKVLPVSNTMAGIFQPYLFNPRGDGVRAPIRQTAIHNPNGLLPKNVAARLWKRRKAAPNPYASVIIGLPQYSEVKASAFSQYGRGRPGSTSFPPPFVYGGERSTSDPLKLGAGRGNRKLAPLILPSYNYAPNFGGRMLHRGGTSLLASDSGIRINPGSY